MSTHSILAGAALIAALAALAALSSAPASAQQRLTPAQRQQARALARTCKPDIQALCSGVRPGGGRIFACLDVNYAQVSPPCQNAMAQAQQLRAQVQATQ